MQVSFTIVAKPSGIEITRSEPSSPSPYRLVKCAQYGNHRAVFMGWLYYQHDLASRFPTQITHILNKALNTNSSNNITSNNTFSNSLDELLSNPAALVLATYLQHGTIALEYLEGDFSLVIWDANTNELIGMRDPMGGYPLFWTQLGETIAFTTSLKLLLNQLPHQALQLEYCADFLTTMGYRNELETEQCSYQGIQRVLPGTIVHAAIPSGRIMRQPYWNWIQRQEYPNTHNLTEMAEQYADVLRSAVCERLQGRTLAHLSGGMDSTSVALLARDEMRRRHGHGEIPLHTISLMYHQLPLLARENPYIECVLQHETDLVSHRILADDILDFDSFVDPPLHDEPFLGLGRLAMDRAMVQLAHHIAADTIVTGIGADEIHDLRPYYLNDWLRQGRVVAAWQNAIQWAKAQNCNVWAILQPYGLVPFIPDGLLVLDRLGWLKQTSMSLNTQHDWTVPAWIQAPFARQHDLQHRAIRHARHTYRCCGETHLSVILIAIASRTGDVLRWTVATPLGIAIAHPFLDCRVISLGLGIQQTIQHTTTPDPDRVKPVLAEAMRGILPDKILNRTWKGHFNEVYYLGLAKNAQYLEEMIEKSSVEELGIFHKAQLIQAIEEASLGIANVRQLLHLNNALCLIRWLTLQDECSVRH